jgi:hypothetical protein
MWAAIGADDGLHSVAPAIHLSEASTDPPQRPGEVTMSEMAFEQVRRLALQLPRAGRARSAAWLAGTIDHGTSDPAPSASRSLCGLWANVGAAPSEADLDAARRALWRTCPREDSA